MNIILLVCRAASWTTFVACTGVNRALYTRLQPPSWPVTQARLREWGAQGCVPVLRRNHWKIPARWQVNILLQKAPIDAVIFLKNDHFDPSELTMFAAICRKSLIAARVFLDTHAKNRTVYFLECLRIGDLEEAATITPSRKDLRKILIKYFAADYLVDDNLSAVSMLREKFCVPPIVFKDAYVYGGPNVRRYMKAAGSHSHRAFGK